jgi:signal peptidase I
MHPFIKDGEVVTVSPVPGGRLYPGDVVAFCHPDSGRLVVHRIIKKNAQGFILQGDSCAEADGLVPAASIVGRVTAVEGNSRIIRPGWGPERLFPALLLSYHRLQLTWYRIRQALVSCFRYTFNK